MIVGRQHTDTHGKSVGSDDGSAFVREGRAPCVVAFHGFTGTTSEIRPLLDVLVERGIAVHAPLLTGHGTHPKELQDVTFDQLVDEMAKELDAARERHGEVVIAGFSLGSLVAMELAARRPEGLLGLVLLGNALTLSPSIGAALGFVDPSRRRPARVTCARGSTRRARTSSPRITIVSRWPTASRASSSWSRSAVEHAVACASLSPSSRSRPRRASSHRDRRPRRALRSRVVRRRSARSGRAAGA